MQYLNPERFINQFKEMAVRLIKPKKFVGLALEDKGILAADVHWEKGRFLTSNTGYFQFPEGIDLKDPERLGKALGEFLQEKRFSGRKAIIGAPAKWVMIREKTIPNLSKENVSGILKIYAEREFSLSPEDLALDYIGPADGDRSNRLFLMAMLRSNLDKAILAVRWAGLDVLAATVSSSVAFSMIQGKMPAPVPRYFLYLRDDYAEFLARDGEQLVDIRHIQKDLKTETTAFAGELRRIISYYSKASNAYRLLIWNATSNELSEEMKILSGSLPSQVKMIEGNRDASVDKLEFIKGEDKDRFIAPLLLARTFNISEPSFIDFLHSRMNAKAGMIKKNQVVWASAVAAGICILFIVIFFIWRGEKKDVSSLKARLDGMGADVDKTKDLIEKVNLSGGWYTERPKVLDCLSALTAVFPEEGKIWVTSLALTERMEGVIAGRATDEKSVIDVLDQLKANSHFFDVQMIYLQNNGTSSQDVSFSMNFSYQDKE